MDHFIKYSLSVFTSKDLSTSFQLPRELYEKCTCCKVSRCTENIMLQGSSGTSQGENASGDLKKVGFFLCVLFFKVYSLPTFLHCTIVEHALGFRAPLNVVSQSLFSCSCVNFNPPRHCTMNCDPSCHNMQAFYWRLWPVTFPRQASSFPPLSTQPTLALHNIHTSLDRHRHWFSITLAHEDLWVFKDTSYVNHQLQRNHFCCFWGK